MSSLELGSGARSATAKISVVGATALVMAAHASFSSATSLGLRARGVDPRRQPGARQAVFMTLGLGVDDAFVIVEAADDAAAEGAPDALAAGLRRAGASVPPSGPWSGGRLMSGLVAPAARRGGAGRKAHRARGRDGSQQHKMNKGQEDLEGPEGRE